MWAGKCSSEEEDESQHGPEILAQVGTKHARISVIAGVSSEFSEQVRSGCVSDIGNRSDPLGWGRVRGQKGQHKVSKRYDDIRCDSGCSETLGDIIWKRDKYARDKAKSTSLHRDRAATPRKVRAGEDRRRKDRANHTDGTKA